MFLNNKLYFKLICDYINNKAFESNFTTFSLIAKEKNKFVNIFYIMIN